MSTHASANPPASRRPDLAIFISFSGEGGVERMVLNLVQGLAQRGLQIDLLALRLASDHLDQLPDSVNLIKLRAEHSATSILELRRYFLANPTLPVLLAAKDRAGRAAIAARRLAGTSTRVAIRLGTTLSAAMARKNALQRFFRYWPIRRSYRHAWRIIAVSDGVREDTLSISRISPDSIVTVRNPVINQRLLTLAKEPVAHRFFSSPEAPVILGVGRLTVQKDFATLLQAFALLCERRDARLLLLGEGKQRTSLMAQAQALGVADKIDLPGFSKNPYAYMARADVFVLSSRWEGSPNVLTEAMALETPVVAADCPSGPREILEAGRIAPLVAMGDAAAMAAAIEQQLDASDASCAYRQATAPYHEEASVTAYLNALGL